MLLGAGIAAGAPAAVPAGAPSGHGDDSQSRRLMLDVEHAQRSGNRMFAMDVALTVAGRFRTDRRILGLTSSDARVSRVLYVYSSPASFRGMALVLEDSTRRGAADRMWISLPALRSFREVDAPSMRLVVPGTGLTYEDARGWVDPDKFVFSAITRDLREVTLEARPINDSLVAVVGSARLSIHVDFARRVVTRVEFLDAAGRIQRTFEARDFVQVEGRWYPTRVRTEHATEHLEADIVYRYRKIQTPPAGLFRFDPQRTFVDRLIDWRNRSGLADALPDTLATAP